MKEVLTKQFWKQVKKTFDEAREHTPPKVADSQTSTGGKPSDSAPPASSSPAVEEQVPQ